MRSPRTAYKEICSRVLIALAAALTLLAVSPTAAGGGPLSSILGDTSRKEFLVDLSPLLAVTLAPIACAAYVIVTGRPLQSRSSSAEGDRPSANTATTQIGLRAVTRARLGRGAYGAVRAGVRMGQLSC